MKGPAMFVFAALLLTACGAEPASPDDVVMDTPFQPQARSAPRSSSKASPPAIARAESLESFWTRFRAAALAGDAAAIRAMSAPVVIQRGILDDTPIVRLPAARVPAVLAQVLTLSDGVDDANRPQREMLEATPFPRRDPEQPVTTHHFGDLVFKQSARGWRLAEIYYEPEE